GPQRVVHRGVHRDADDDQLELIVDRDLLHRSDFRAAKSHRTVSIEPARIRESDGDVAAAEIAVAHDEVSRHENGKHRDDPDPWRPLREMDFRFRRWFCFSAIVIHVVVLAHEAGTPAVFHMSFGSKRRTASISSATIAKSGVAAGPATISSMP